MTGTDWLFRLCGSSAVALPGRKVICLVRTQRVGESGPHPDQSLGVGMSARQARQMAKSLLEAADQSDAQARTGCRAWFSNRIGKTLH